MDSTYLIDDVSSTTSCIRTLLDAGVDPAAIRIHRWAPLLAVRVSSAIPDGAATSLQQLGLRPLEPGRFSEVGVGTGGPGPGRHPRSDRSP